MALFFMTVLALLLDNTSASQYYHQFFNALFSIQLGPFGLSKPMILWINDGLMAIFFLLVGLEIKRELFEGEMNSFSKAILPAIAALGGMVLPAAIYLAFNFTDAEALKGWAIPTATDIAFSLGILSLLGTRVPVSLKIFLMALAIFDDIGAVIVIAVFYTSEISIMALAVSAFLMLILLILNRMQVTSYFPYIFIGLILWVVVLKSGLHPTLAGIVLAFAIPLRDPKKPNHQPAQKLIKILHPWVAFLILPLFALANAGVSFAGLSFSHFAGPISIGIALGLFFGKQLGIWGATMLAVKLKIAKMPLHSTPASLYGIALLGGVGFTMSLFVGTLAFEFGNNSSLYGAMVKTGVLSGSILSGLFGYFLLRYIYPPKKMSRI